MSNIIPPLVSSSPPPMVAGEPDDLDEDEFGDFTAAGDFSFDGYSLPSTPQHVPYTYTTTSISTSTFNNSSPSRPVQTNSTIVSPKNSKMKKDNILSEPATKTTTFNRQKEYVDSDQFANQLTQTKTEIINTETNKLSEINNSKHIFCDITTDVHKPETIINVNSPQVETDISTFTTFVQNTDSDFDDNIVLRTNQEPTIAKMKEDYCDRRKNITTEFEFGDFASNICVNDNLPCKKLNVNVVNNLEICESREEVSAFATNLNEEVEIVKNYNMDGNIVMNSKNSLNFESGSKNKEIGNINNLKNIDYPGKKDNLLTLDEIQDDFTEFKTINNEVKHIKNSDTGNIENCITLIENTTKSDLTTSEESETHDFGDKSDTIGSTNYILDSESQVSNSDDFGDFHSKSESTKTGLINQGVSETHLTDKSNDSDTTNGIIGNEIIKISETDDCGDFETKLQESDANNFKPEKISCTETAQNIESINFEELEIISQNSVFENIKTELINDTCKPIDEECSELNFGEIQSNKTIELNSEFQVIYTHDFEDFKSNTKSIQQTSETDDFGDFESTSPSKRNLQTIPTVSDASEFRNFNNNSPNEVNVDPCPKVTDDFGEFNSNKTNFENKMQDSEIDDFGDFESDIPAIKDNKMEPTFGYFKSSASEIKNETNQTNTKESTVNKLESNFGDFSNSVIETDKVLNESIVTNAQSNFDDFGDFNNFAAAEDNSTAIENLPNVLDVSVNAEALFKSVFTLQEQAELEFKCIDFMDNNVFKNVQDIEHTNALSYHWANSESQKTLLRALNIDSRNILFGPRWNASMPRFAANLGFTPLEPVKTELLSVSQPLQPQQQLQPTISVPPRQIEPLPCDVPAAKFDWTSSGLVNPLDYSQSNTMLLDLEQLVTSLDIPHVTMAQIDSDTTPLDLDSWDYWLQNQSTEPVKPESIADKISIQFDQQTATPKEFDSIPNAQLDIILNNFSHLTQSDNESVNSLKFIDTPTDIENEFEIDRQSLDKSPTENIPIDNNDDFTNFQSSKPVIDNNWSNMIPFKMHLRETHISNESDTLKNPQIFNIESLELKSTIVTPELSHKTIEINVEDDDFADFQMSLPPKAEKSKPVEVMTLEPLKPVILDTGVNNIPAQINWPEPGIIGDDIAEFQFSYTANEVSVGEVSKMSPDTSEINVETAKMNVETKSILEPDIQKVELKPVLVPVVVKQKKQTEVEDDWSDFVCAQETSKDRPNPIPQNNQNSNNKTQNNFNLFQTQPFSQLSISNLQNTQLKHQVLPPIFVPTSSPTKINPYAQISTQQVAAQQIGYGYQPPYQIPVQTINTPFGGLPQTSLSSYNHYSVGQTELTVQNPSKSRANQSLRNNDFGMFNNSFPSEMKSTQSYNPPQISESQYQNYTMHTVESTFLKMQPPIKQFSITSTQDDEDDWSDFVSSQPVPNNTLNGLSNPQTQSKAVNKPFPNSYNNKPTVWANNEQTPNIITNPVHFKVFQSYQTGGSSQDSSKTQNNKKSGNHSKNKSSVPSIPALPDLDFIAPKNKLFSKK